MSPLLSIAVALMLQTPSDSAPCIKFQVFKSGSYSAATDQKLVAIKSAEAWKAYWNQQQVGQPVPPGVDWTTSELLAIHLGRRNTGGFGVYVDEIVRVRGKSALVKIVEQRPPKGGMVTMALTSPFVIVKVPSSMNAYRLSKVVDQATGQNPDPRPKFPPSKPN